MIFIIDLIDSETLFSL